MARATRTRSTPVLITAIVLGLAARGLAFAQSALPWQSSSPPPPPPSQYSAPQSQYAPPPAQYQPQGQPSGQGGHHHHSSGAPAPYQAAPGSRAQDDRDLDKLATQYYHVGTKDPVKAIAKLKSLQHKTHELRERLENAPYDASDILKDTKSLEGRISAKRKKLEAEQAAAEPAPAPVPPVPPQAGAPAPVPPAPPVSPPPGSSSVPPMPQTQPMIPAPPPPGSR